MRLCYRIESHAFKCGKRYIKSDELVYIQTLMIRAFVHEQYMRIYIVVRAIHFRRDTHESMARYWMAIFFIGVTRCRAPADRVNAHDTHTCAKQRRSHRHSSRWQRQSAHQWANKQFIVVSWQLDIHRIQWQWHMAVLYNSTSVVTDMIGWEHKERRNTFLLNSWTD